MAIPALPNNLDIQNGNQQLLLTWDNATGATSYAVQRSTNGVDFTAYDTSLVNSYLDTAATLGVMYFYQVASVNSNGTSSYAPPVQMVCTPNSEMSLFEIRLRSQQRADRVNSQFVSRTEWNFFINQAMTELYDLLITTYEDYYCAPEITFQTNGSDYLYPLPNGTLTFTDSNSGATIVAEPYYKLLGLDLGLNQVNNAYVTVNKFNLIDRNRFVYPNTASTIYGVFNLRYRIMGEKIRFIPTPTANQVIRLLYVPRLAQLLQDADYSTIGISGWLQYVIVRAAKYALDKEESDTSKLDAELGFLTKRVEASAPNRDAGAPDTISDTRGNSFGDGSGMGFGSMKGGF